MNYTRQQEHSHEQEKDKEDDDYMNIKFEDTKSVSVEPKDLPPSKTKSLKNLEKERREEALETSLLADENNIGLQLLRQMGFTATADEPAALGKGTMEGLVEPIKPVDLGKKRSGLGVSVREDDTQRKRKHSEVEQDTEEQEKAHAEMLKRFQQRQKSQFKASLVQKDIRDARIACEQLDKECGYPESEFWFETSETTEDTETEENPEDLLFQMMVYLRTKHFYCIYCGAKYDSYDELEEECPGIFREDH